MDGELQSPLDPAPLPSTQATVTALDRVSALFEVLLCSGFPTQIMVITVLAGMGMRPRTPAGDLSAPFIYTLTLVDTVFVVSLVALFFHARGESIRQQLFASSAPRRDVLIGVLLVPASLVAVVLVLVLIQIAAPRLRDVPHNPLADLAKTRLQAAIFAVVVMVAGGVREEVQRGFVLRRFEQYLGGGALGVVLFSIAFGLGHLEQGHDVAIATGVLGACWGAVFLARRSIVGPMIGHAGFNLTQVAKFLILGS